jgi:hypothetical protein
VTKKVCPLRKPDRCFLERSNASESLKLHLSSPIRSFTRYGVSSVLQVRKLITDLLEKTDLEAVWPWPNLCEVHRGRDQMYTPSRSENRKN